MYFNYKKILDWVLERFSSGDSHKNRRIRIEELNKSNDCFLFTCFAYSPFAYTLIGLYFYIIAFYNGPIYPGHYFDSILLINQGIFSYLGDVYS